MEKEKDTLAVRYSFVDLQLRSLLGRVLTFIDASEAVLHGTPSLTRLLGTKDSL